MVQIKTMSSDAVARIYGEYKSGYAFGGNGTMTLVGRLVISDNVLNWKQQIETMEKSKDENKNRQAAERPPITIPSKCRIEVLWGRVAIYICDKETILLLTNSSVNNYRIVKQESK